MTTRNIQNLRVLDIGFDPRKLGLVIPMETLVPDKNGVLTVLYEDPDGKKLEAVDVTPECARDCLRAAGYEVKDIPRESRIRPVE